MKKILYYTTWDFSDGVSSGITNKIRAQIKAMEEGGLRVDYTYISEGKICLCENGKTRELGGVGRLRKINANRVLLRRMKNRKYDGIYHRYGLMDTYAYKVLKQFHQSGAAVVIEMPTYPYDQEREKGLQWWALFTWDKLYRNRLKKVVDFIFTYSEDDSIFGIPARKIVNGIDFDRMRAKRPKKENHRIDLLAVAGLAKWHGYDRLLKGLGEYYRQGGERPVHFHLVGDGPPMKEYREIIKEYGIREHVSLYGVKRNDELDDIYDHCDMGVENLGFHRTGVFMSSSLKSREYTAKGLPFITSCRPDIFENQFFVLQFPSDDSAIDINRVADFYDKLYADGSQKDVIDRIRDTAKGLCDMRITMLPVVGYFEEKRD